MYRKQATGNKRKYKPAANPSNILFFLKTGWLLVLMRTPAWAFLKISFSSRRPIIKYFLRLRLMHIKFLPAFLVVFKFYFSFFFAVKFTGLIFQSKKTFTSNSEVFKVGFNQKFQVNSNEWTVNSIIARTISSLLTIATLVPGT